MLGVDWVDLAGSFILSFLLCSFSTALSYPNPQAVELVSVGKGVLLGEESYSVSVFSSFSFSFQYFLYFGCFLDSDKLDAFHCMHGCKLIWCGFSSQFYGWIDIIS